MTKIRRISHYHPASFWVVVFIRPSWKEASTWSLAKNCVVVVTVIKVWDQGCLAHPACSRVGQSIKWLMIGAYYNGPKFKYQLLSGTGWFSYKIWTKNYKTSMVNLLKNLRPFFNYNFKIQLEIHFWLFKIMAKNLQEKNLE